MAAIKKHDPGTSIKEVCHAIGISEVTFYNWKAKYGGMEASDFARMKELEKENAAIKKMFAEVSI